MRSAGRDPLLCFSCVGKEGRNGVGRLRGWRRGKSMEFWGMQGLDPFFRLALLALRRKGGRRRLEWEGRAVVCMISEFGWTLLFCVH